MVRPAECVTKTWIRELFAKNTLKFILLATFAISIFCPFASTQTLTIRLLNAKSGKPMGRQNVTIKWDSNFKTAEVIVDNNGVGRVIVPTDARQFVMISGPKTGQEPNRIAFRNCNDQTSILLSVSDAIHSGIVPKNVCSNKNISAQPGEVIFWGLPRPFWDFQ